MRLLTFPVHFKTADSLLGAPDHRVPVSGIGVERVEAVSPLQPVVARAIGGGDTLVAPNSTSVGRHEAEAKGGAEDHRDP